MRRAFPGLGRAIRVLAIVAAVFVVAACGDWEATKPGDGRPFFQGPPAEQPPATPGAQPPLVVVDTTPPALVVDTGATPGGWLAVDHTATSDASSIYLVRPDGSEIVRLTKDHWDYSPAWSPDGAWIAFQRDGDGIWVIRPNGSGERRVAADGYNPAWLEDGRVGYQCSAGLCGVAVDGSNPVTVIARVKSDGTYEDSYVFSPDGRKLAFARGRFTTPNGNLQFVLYVANSDGSDARRLTSSSSDYESSPRWSKDGTRIAFWSMIYGIVVADADGRNVHSVSRRVAQIGFPAWSADGTQIVFGQNAKEFYIANADGTGTIRRVRTTLTAWLDDWGGSSSTWSWSPR